MIYINIFINITDSRFFIQKEMKETFFLSNIVPQDFQNNGGYWNLMEIYCRELAKKYQDVFIYSGPLFLPYKTEGGKKEIVQYQVKLKWI